jgi:hypothetical protein
MLSNIHIGSFRRERHHALLSRCGKEICGKEINVTMEAESTEDLRHADVPGNYGDPDA